MEQTMLSDVHQELLSMVIDRFGPTEGFGETISQNALTKIINFPNAKLEDLAGVDIEYEFNDIFYPKGSSQFAIPPVSYFDTKQSYWTARKDGLKKRFGNIGETMDNVLGDSIISKINQGASYFDPVLCETIISWFNTFGGRVLNPFCGEASIGMISSSMGCPFVGVDIRQEQVDKNNAICADAPGFKPKFICGNSLDLTKILIKHDVQDKFDLVFSSPPYYELEIYSAKGGDLSNKKTYKEFMGDYLKIFEQAIERLNNNRFLVVKVGEIRDDGGVYRNFIGNNITLFTKYLGLKYYNEIILLNQFGTAPLRFNINFKTRKIVKIHQNILVFFKGNVKEIQGIYKDINKPLDVLEQQKSLW